MIDKFLNGHKIEDKDKEDGLSKNIEVASNREMVYKQPNPDGTIQNICLLESQILKQLKERPQCLLCMKILAADNMKPSK
jgi:hypothetical protein